jgi:ribosomal protein S18 acetylase RimI-like enzyme
MSLTIVPESPARWDADKQRIIAGAPRGVFDSRYSQRKSGDLLPGDWFRAEKNGAVVGYGWLDVVWGDAEILLATDGSAQRSGVGTLLLDRLEDEAKARGLSYLYNVIRPTHPKASELARWLEKRGFTAGEDGRLVRSTKR